MLKELKICAKLQKFCQTPSFISNFFVFLHHYEDIYELAGP